MATTTGVPQATLEPAQDTAPPQLATLGWALRRAALGMLMLLGMVTLLVWLYAASIEPDDQASLQAGAPASIETGSTTPNR